jgi:hemoglobin
MGTQRIFDMCEAFYAELEQSSIRHLFSDDMPAASRRLAAFLVGVCGGPPLYRELHGEPMMRKRHLPFAIDEEARRVWLACFKRVLANADRTFGFPAEHLASFITYLEDFSAWMVNRRSGQG